MMKRSRFRAAGDIPSPESSAIFMIACCDPHSIVTKFNRSKAAGSEIEDDSVVKKFEVSALVSGSVQFPLTDAGISGSAIAIKSPPDDRLLLRALRNKRVDVRSRFRDDIWRPRQTDFVIKKLGLKSDPRHETKKQGRAIPFSSLKPEMHRIIARVKTHASLKTIASSITNNTNHTFINIRKKWRPGRHSPNQPRLQAV